MTELNIFHGDTVLLRGNKRKMCPAVAIKDDELDNEKIRMNRCIRNNLRVRLGDIVNVKPKTDIVNLTKIHILPFADSIEGLEGDLA
jgi:transitional endoplasmic reticulum ATPase